jgi:hypothetical protein
MRIPPHSIPRMRRLVALVAIPCAIALDAGAGDRLVVSGGAQQLEGAGGGGIVPWALITGYGTNRQWGGSAFATRVGTQDFSLDAYGVAVGAFDRVEVSYARQSFDAGSVVPGLKLKQDIIGAKVRIWGDAVYDQDDWWPQVSVGLQHKKNLEMAIPTAVGAKRGSDTDFYVSAAKIWLAGLAGRNVFANLTLRATRANQMGLLGFGGDRKDSRSVQAEYSGGVLLTDKLALGAEYRTKPNNLSAFREDDFSDVFVAWFPTKRIALTLAWARLGSVAGKPGQDGAYLSLQITE